MKAELEEMPIPPPPPRTAEEKAHDMMPDPAPIKDHNSDWGIALILLLAFVYLAFNWRPIKNRIPKKEI